MTYSTYIKSNDYKTINTTSYDEQAYRANKADKRQAFIDAQRKKMSVKPKGLVAWLIEGLK